jgi:hypothetical protein
MHPQTLSEFRTELRELGRPSRVLIGWSPAIQRDRPGRAMALTARPMITARIGVMRALNHHVERVFDPSRKDKHWGRRKLARD